MSCRRGIGPVLQLGRFSGFGPLAANQDRVRADDIPRRRQQAGRENAFFLGYAPQQHRLRLSARADAHTRGDAHPEHALERLGNVGAQTHGHNSGAEHRYLFRAVAQTARITRIPPQRTVQQHQPRPYPHSGLRAGTAGSANRSGADSNLVHRRRRRNGRNADEQLRPRPATVLHAALSRHGRHSRTPLADRPLVLRLFQA